MSLLQISHVDKQIKLSEKSFIDVLQEINITFPDVGLVGILGKSGCGKSTLLNLIALLDKPTQGDIIIDDKSTKRWKRKQIDKFRRDEIGIIFQNYNLLEDQDVIYNISLPLLINGYSYKEAEAKATSLLESISFPKDLYHLSSGNFTNCPKLTTINYAGTMEDFDNLSKDTFTLPSGVHMVYNTSFEI